MKRRTIYIVAAVLLAVAAIIASLLVRERVQRHRVFRPSGGEVRAVPPKGIPPVEQWSDTFRNAGTGELSELLERIEVQHPDLYSKWSLAYLHARAEAEQNDRAEAIRRLAPFLEKGHPLRDRALYHRASVAEGAEASGFRMALISEHPDSIYRDEAIDDELEYLASLDGARPLIEFADKLAPSASTERRREMSARIVEALVEAKQIETARTRGMAILAAGTVDDAADRVTRALDRPEVIKTLTPQQLETFGETFQQHRHYDRAIALLQMALQRMPAARPAARPVAPKPAQTAKAAKTAKTAPKKKAKTATAKKTAKSKKASAAPAKAAPPPVSTRSRRDELEFAVGRSYFGAEKYEEAQAVYLRGANTTTDRNQKATFLWHAARAAQLRGDDPTAEKLMTAAIAVPGKYASTTVALTQRMRTRLKQRRLAEAAADLAQLRKMAGSERAILDGSLAYAVAMLANGNATAALSALNSIPPALLDDYDKAEVAYWRARSLEEKDPPASFRAYLEVLRADVPTHFAYFARTRLDAPAMAPKLAADLAAREAEVSKLIAAKSLDLARRMQTDRILLSSRGRDAQLKRLRTIYLELPAYRAILELAPAALPRFPAVDATDTDALLMAMGLYDEAVPAIEKRFALRPPSQALSRSYALNLGAASRDSIYAIEVLMKSVPSDFHPDLLPEVVRELLYPRYFYDFIAADAKRYETDPALVLSIMREESRFNPRAKSQAAARGLLQFIITTARDIGRDVGLVDVDPQDLYDPRVIIRLGAKYISELGKQFGGNRYRVAAAYNAGPKQVALWNRLQPGEGDDYFLTAVNFDETKHYVRKVMNSYARYQEIYGPHTPAGGLRAEP